MVAAKYTLTLERGANENKVFIYKDSTGSAVNLTGYTASTIFLDKAGGATLLTLSSPSSGIVLGGAAGTITHSFTLSQVAALPQKGVFRTKLTLSGITTRIVQGEFYVDPE